MIVNAALGAGLLNFPKAFDQAGGIQVALAVQLILVIFVIISLLILGKCSDACNADTVQVLTFSFYPNLLKLILNISLHRLPCMELVGNLDSILVPYVLHCIPSERVLPFSS